MTRGADATPTSARPRAARRRRLWELLWNNPKLHTPERRKVWLACDEHRESLSDFLGARAVPQGRRAARATRRARRRRAAQPPIADIGRSGCRNVGSSMPWPGACRASRSRQRSAISSSSAPPRSARAQVGLLAGEQAVADLAVGGEPHPVAVAAERPGDRGDDARRWPGRRRRRTARRARCPAARSAGVERERGAERREDLVGGDHRRRGSSRAGRRAASAR